MPTEYLWIRRISASVLIAAFLWVNSAAHSQTTRYVAPGGSDVGECSNQVDERDGAIYNWTDGAIEVSNSQFELNTAGGIGGGTCLDGSSPTLVNLTFTDNQALAINGSGLGGGMRNVNNSSAVLTRVTFTGNYADSLGGGIYNSGNSSPQLTQVRFIANESGADGGGIANVNASHPMLVNVLFESSLADNSDGEGGGMFNGGGSNPGLLDVLLLENQADRGGGLLNRGSNQPLLQNVRFMDNLASQGGRMANFAGSPTLINGLFHGNTTNSCGGMHNADDAVPTLWNVSFNGDLRLMLTSPAIDAGDPGTDLSQFPVGPDISKVFGRLLSLIAKLLAESEDARPHFERALVLYDREYGDTHPYTLGTSANLGWLLSQLGEFDQDETLLSRGQALRQLDRRPEAKSRFHQSTAHTRKPALRRFLTGTTDATGIADCRHRNRWRRATPVHGQRNVAKPAPGKPDPGAGPKAFAVHGRT